MKKILTLLLCAGFFSSAFAQNDRERGRDIVLGTPGTAAENDRREERRNERRKERDRRENRDVRWEDRNERRDDDRWEDRDERRDNDRRSNKKAKKYKKNKGNRYGWERGVGNPHRTGSRNADRGRRG